MEARHGAPRSKQSSYGHDVGNALDCGKYGAFHLAKTIATTRAIKASCLGSSNVGGDIAVLCTHVGDGTPKRSTSAAPALSSFGSFGRGRCFTCRGNGPDIDKCHGWSRFVKRHPQDDTTACGCLLCANDDGWHSLDGAGFHSGGCGSVTRFPSTGICRIGCQCLFCGKKPFTISTETLWWPGQLVWSHDLHLFSIDGSRNNHGGRKARCYLVDGRVLFIVFVLVWSFQLCLGRMDFENVREDIWVRGDDSQTSSGASIRDTSDVGHNPSCLDVHSECPLVSRDDNTFSWCRPGLWRILGRHDGAIIGLRRGRPITSPQRIGFIPWFHA
mmetsp:Transcript_28393/g.65914  ORF Transcript_28393/g.65914 Transcript_28393/m.65914 type:complete len:329 (+) Transcript_28393:251-1237(+)